MSTAHRFDLELTARDLQSLAGADALAALFTRLGYATGARAPQTTASLGISTESLARQIFRVERLADHEGFLQIYLFEAKSVTVALIRGLARAFRNLNVQFPLLVLATPDYDRVDFVLLERSAPEGTDARRLLPTTPQVAVRLRVLSIERRKPTALQRRILQRFTWTEPDPFAQFDKLAAAYVLVEWSEQYFNNRALFSDHYLLDRLQGMPEWQEDPKPAYRRLRELYLEAAPRLASKNEEDLRRELFDPALSALGFELHRGNASKSDAEADYLLFTPDQTQCPTAVCLTYCWDRFLDGKDYQRGDDTPEENPGALVVTLLEQGPAAWAIITNGRLWRLYSRHTHARATNYYEIDLEEALSRTAPESENPAEAFRYFWLLFREPAFAPRKTLEHGETKQGSFVDQVLRESEEYAKELGERLKERVFTEVFPHLAEGFLLSLRTSEVSAPDESARLDDVFRATLTLLYRLLFLLYAESRGLLPVRETRDYYESSLQRLKGEIAEEAGAIRDEVPERLGRRYRKNETGLYDRLRQLFRFIDQGERELNLAAYNGGLFAISPAEEDITAEAEAARFLEAHTVPDLHLALALDLLSRDEDPRGHGLVAVDYKSLGVRQLGSIYEGLLEFKLRIAEKPLAVIKEKGREVYVPLEDLDEPKRERAKRRGRVKKRGELYLENDKHERKATGSYYTPGFIVQYIVEQTLGPLLRDRFDSLRPKLREAQTWHRRKLEEARAKGEPPNKYEDGPAVLERWRSEILDPLFDIRVLDPAMGSGHFLVEAADFITDKMLDFLNGFRWNPVQAYLAQTRREILQSAEQQEVILAPERLTDVNLLKRHVLKRCLYGVDLNPMAVELAKVSLWLHCFTLGAPLSFLDHHLRCGNSLIGVGVDEVRELLEGREGEQITIFGSRFAQLLLATDLMRRVGELSDVTTAQVAESRRQYDAAADALAPFQRMLDVYTSQWFGNHAGDDRRQRGSVPEAAAVAFLKAHETEAFLAADTQAGEQEALGRLPKDLRIVAARALAAAEQSRFFHWELEFPEIFFGPRPGTQRVIERKENPGFDAVLGNPPYVRMELIKPLKPFLKARYRCHEERADLFIYFYERAVSVLRQGGQAAFIASSTWTRTNAGRHLREYLQAETTVLSFIDFGDLPVFAEATTYPCVMVLSRQPAASGHEVAGLVLSALRQPNLAESVRREGVQVPQQSLQVGGWRFEDRRLARLREKIMNAGVPLREYCGSPLYGIKTGLNQAFVVDQETRDALVAADPHSKEVLKPFLEGKDLRPWHAEWRKLWLIYTYHGIDIKRYPGIREHLRPFRNALEARATAAHHAWYELQQPQQGYQDHLEAPKIIWPEFSSRPKFSLETQMMYFNNKVYFIPSPKRDYYLLGLLHSAPLWFSMKGLATALRGGNWRYELFSQVMELLPVPDRGQPAALAVACLARKISEGSDAAPLLGELDAAAVSLFGLDQTDIRLMNSEAPSSHEATDDRTH